MNDNQEAVPESNASEGLRMHDIYAYYLTPLTWIRDASSQDDPEAEHRRGGREVYRSIIADNITMRVRNDGMFIFDFSNSPPSLVQPSDQPFDWDSAHEIMLRRVRLLNAHLVCLYTAISRCHDAIRTKMALSPADVILLSPLDAQFNPAFNDPRSAALVLTQQPSSYGREIPMLNRLHIMDRHTMKVESVAVSFALLNEILQRPAGNTLLVAELLLRSCKSMEDDDDNLCVIFAWAVIEKLMVQLWDNYMTVTKPGRGQDKPDMRMEKNWQKLRKNGYTPNFKDMVGYLRDKGSIPPSLHDELVMVCDARDGWLHRLESVSPDRATDALFLAVDLLRLIDGIQFHLDAAQHMMY